MNDKILISGFADEISPLLSVQLPLVKALGMEHICMRFADGKSIADYSPEEFSEKLLPQLQAAGVKLSSLGSPIGKIGIEDEEGYALQLKQLDNLCRICRITGCRYIRVFSFWMPKGKDPDDYTDQVLQKLAGFAEVASKYDVVLIHENEKDIYGDIGRRCRLILEKLGTPHFRAAFDFANFVQCGEDTAECWELMKEYVSYIHIKDAVYTSNENVPAGTGDGKLPQILKQAILEDGYEGFLTLEPHLAAFGSFAALEVSAEGQARMNKAKDGADGYTIQYHALCEILKDICRAAGNT